MAAHQAPQSLGFSRQEHWSGLPFPSPMHESEKWRWSCSVVSDSLRPHGLQPTRLFCHGVFQVRVLEWGAIAFSAVEWQWIPYHMCSSLTRNHSRSWGSTFTCPYLALRILPLSHITLFLNTQPNLPEAFTKYRRSPWLRAVFVFCCCS